MLGDKVSFCLLCAHVRETQRKLAQPGRAKERVLKLSVSVHYLCAHYALSLMNCFSAEEQTCKHHTYTKALKTARIII